MWILRDIQEKLRQSTGLPIKILTGPRQCGKTSVLAKTLNYQVIYFDDLHVRKLATDDPKFFLDQYPDHIILDEATLVEPLFYELKRRVDEYRRLGKVNQLDIWVTGSNQYLLQKNVQESLAGRASYYHMNTLSWHELVNHFGKNDFGIQQIILKGGWPELYVNTKLNSLNYINDFIATYIEKDIVGSSGIEKKSAFMMTLKLAASRIGQLMNFSDLSRDVGVDNVTVQSWLNIASDSGVVTQLKPYHSNLNKRLIKSSKFYFDDVGLASRLQGWSSFEPLMLSSQFGFIIENLIFCEIKKFFLNQDHHCDCYFVRSKEKVEVDFLIALPNNKYLAIEVKNTAVDFTVEQLKLLDSLKINIVEKWIVTPQKTVQNFKNSRVVELSELYQKLVNLVDS